MDSVGGIQTELFTGSIEEFQTEEEIRTDMPLGWRFVPTDEELIVGYLMNKVCLRSLPCEKINEIDAIEFYSKHPKDLVKSISGEPVRHFFVRNHKYVHGEIDKKRSVGDGIGYWRCIGKEDPIYDRDGNLRALKIHSTYFSVMPKVKKTHWRLEEYRLVDVEPSTPHEGELHIGDWVVARITSGKLPKR